MLAEEFVEMRVAVNRIASDDQACHVMRSQFDGGEERSCRACVRPSSGWRKFLEDGRCGGEFDGPLKKLAPSRGSEFASGFRPEVFGIHVTSVRLQNEQS